MPGIVTVLLAVLGAATAAVVVVEATHRVLRRVGRRSEIAADLARTAHKPFLATATVFAVQQAVRGFGGEFPARGGVLHALVLVFIASFAWLIGALLLVLEDMALSRWRTDVADNLRARRLKTQVVMLRRVTVATIVVITLGVMLMTFPNIRALGASLLASAGLVSVIAALAAQSTLGNLFAGLQLAFSDAIRVDDVVVVEEEWGRIEEITLSYVVVQIWDERRLILPTSYFTSKPFQNWTRTSSAVLGTAEIDMDWSVPVDELRAEMRRVCEATELWDERVCVLQVTDAVGGMIRVRALVSAHDAPTLWDLRCLVREKLVGFVWENQKLALPRLRADVGGPAPRVSEEPATEPIGAATPQQPTITTRTGRSSYTDTGEGSHVFSGDREGVARGAAFVGPDGDDRGGQAKGHDGVRPIGPEEVLSAPPR
ncbi:mechanosensitive ion channel family protein [Mangrovihabitans endophyticus]|uniref:Mechanosensitive ion channel protein MscS n=1 Tax=Mangrovihabitans endophyticus TaxID=1751298 RepID=A0A8J3FMR8_9ACTN|nr:mechanosensitive ion channel family protein [Mangrovihabitans endophyticus]GGK85422.1 mechanosensitive ion channel protein MscS [Mangrovihabitans endophyticus]